MSSAECIDANAHPIKAVTVFQAGRAEVSRSFKLQLRAGTNNVTVENLPSCIDKDSLRVNGKGARPVLVADVVYHPPKSDNSVESSPELKKIEYSIATARGRQAILNEQIAVMKGYGYSLRAEKSNLNNLVEFMNMQSDMGAKILGGLQTVETQIEALEKEREQLLEDSKSENRRRRGVKISVVLQAQVSTEISLDLVYCCLSPSIKWSPIYDLRAVTVDGRPTSSVQVHFRACITQTTGEDWENCAVTLSTVETMSNAVIPRHGNVRVRAKPAPQGPPPGFSFGGAQQQSSAGRPANLQQVQQAMQQQQQQQQQQMASFGSTQPQPQMSFGSQQPQPQMAFGSQPPQQLMASFGSQMPSFGSTAPPAVSAEAPMLMAAPVAAAAPRHLHSEADYDVIESTEETENSVQELVDFGTNTTIVTDNAVGGLFLIDGKSSIPSDTATHKVSIAVLQCQSSVRWISVPHVTPDVAYMEVRNTSGYKLYPGPISIFMDDGYIAKSQVKHVNPNEYFSCSLGVDPSIRVNHRDSFRTLPHPTSSFAARTETQLHTTTFYVKNKGKGDISRLFLKDSLPITDSSSPIRVVLKQPKLVVDGQAVKGDVVVQDGVIVRWATYAGGDKEGRLEFVCDVKAGREIEFSLEYEISGPMEGGFLMERL